jgi:putative redox protein
MSEITVTYEGSLHCTATHESGTVITTDAPRDNQGNGESFSPSELLSVSLGSCILSIMGIAARSLGIDLSGATADVEKVMANAPRRISKMAVRVRVPGVLDERQRKQLEEAAHACPVHSVLNVDVPILFEWD